MAETARQMLDYAQVALDAAGAGASSASGGATDPLVFHLAIFVLAVFVGAYLVRPAAPSLRAPLTAFATAIASIIVVGALISVGVDASVAGEDGPLWARLFGFAALILTWTSMFGGFLLAHRLLAQGAKES